jgi:hypothetical protein
MSVSQFTRETLDDVCSHPNMPRGTPRIANPQQPNIDDLIRGPLLSPKEKKIRREGGNLRFDCARDVSSDIGANVGIDSVCYIEEHCCLGIRAHDLHDTVEVVALGLPFKDAAHQDVTLLRRRVHFSYKGVVLIQRHAQY